jgi:hypothetical protein
MSLHISPEMTEDYFLLKCLLLSRCYELQRTFLLLGERLNNFFVACLYSSFTMSILASGSFTANGEILTIRITRSFLKNIILEEKEKEKLKLADL